MKFAWNLDPNDTSVTITDESAQGKGIKIVFQPSGLTFRFACLPQIPQSHLDGIIADVTAVNPALATQIQSQVTAIQGSLNVKVGA